MNINWYPGHMLKTKKQMIEDLKLIDVVIEILDARIPVSSQNPDIQNITRNKKKIVLLNKSDLADEKDNQRWKQYFIEQGYKAVLVDSNSGKGVNDVIKQTQEIMKEEIERLASKGRIGKKIAVFDAGRAVPARIDPHRSRRAQRGGRFAQL
jgi:ribosome biogenesis GTPase A